MSDGITSFLGLIKPAVGGSSTTWGTKINGDLDALDAFAEKALDKTDTAGETVAGPLQLEGQGDSSSTYLTPMTNGKAATDTWVRALINKLLPIGTILMWGGTIATIPSGWALCDGATVSGVATPNLADRFVMGGSTPGQFQPGEFGGAVTHTHTLSIAGTALSIAEMPVHSHAVSDPGHNHAHVDPTHAHTTAMPGITAFAMGNPGGAAIGLPDGTVNQVSSSSATGMVNSAAATGIALFNTGGGAAHGHAGSTANAGGNLPPFYTLAYIIKVRDV